MQEPQQHDQNGEKLLDSLATMPGDRCLYCGDPAELVCDDCDKKIEADNARLIQEQEAKKEATRLQWFADRIPDDYLTPDDLLTPPWASELATCWNPHDRYGVTIQGPSESWKTRAGIKLLEKAFLNRKSFEFHQAGELRREFNRLARDGKDSGFLKRLAAIELMMIDDLGNQAFTEASEEFFLALLEGRANQRNKTIITTQFPSDEFIAKTSNRRIGVAIARRIGPEFNWIVSTTGKGTAQINSPTPPAAR